MTLRAAIQVSNPGKGWDDVSTFVREAEQLGIDSCWVAEAWGADAVSAIGFLAAVTSRITLGSGVLQVSSRTATMTARTALALSAISRGRFMLGLGVSGPQVVEGLDGVPFDRPLDRLRDTISLIRLLASGERVQFEGRTFALPLPGGRGKALRLMVAPDPSLRIYLATLGPRMLELTGELADGWLGTSFIPESDYYRTHIAAGAARASRDLADVDLCQGGEVAFARDDAELAEMIRERKPGLAFSLGGMGSATSNFYNAAYAAQGFADTAAEVQALWMSGRHDLAAAAVPDEMVLATTLIGDERRVAERLTVWCDAGIGTVRLYPAGANLAERLTTLGRAMDIIATINAAGDPA
jgi:F420-dependent oxidoreductase-like protein